MWLWGVRATVLISLVERRLLSDECLMCVTFRELDLLLSSGIKLISGYRCDGDEICGLLGYNAASSGNPLPTFRDNV
jgi:hypothetical protein